jgi:uncharacterized protein YndB with AHSA1/START domain
MTPGKMTQRIERSVLIKAQRALVWQTLTTPTLMKQWMAEPEMELEIIVDWRAGSPMVIKGFHHIPFENKGRVLRFESERILSYDYLSSLSRLPDKPENRTIVEFQLGVNRDHTSLTVTLRNFPTESIFKHVDFYWNTTIKAIKNFVEQANETGG